jgi:hypothetical protein
MESARKSVRGQGLTEGSVLERAMRATANKDPGTSKSIADFAVLQEVPVDHLLAIAKDSSIVFSSAAGPPAEIISALRAKELAQAELALARAKIEAQQAKEKEKANSRTLDVPAEVNTEGEAPPTAPPEGSGAAKTSMSKPQKKTQKKQIPVGHRPVTRQARAKGAVS